MAWILKFAVGDDDVEVVSSQLWDAGTTGIVQLDGELLAGFDDRAMAETVATRADGWPATVLSIEPSEWTGTDEETLVPLDDVDAGGGSGVGAGGGSGGGGESGSVVTLSIVAGPTFGHGGHPTTALAIELLSRAVRDRVEAGQAPSVLDVGTGSGVLAIGAAALGAGPVVGIDIDPEALTVARANAERNGVEILTSDVAPDEAATLIDRPGFDVVVANVLAPVQRQLAPALAAALSSGGSLITAGYLVEDGPDVIDVHRSAMGAAVVGPTGPVVVRAEQQLDGWLAHRFDR